MSSISTVESGGGTGSNFADEAGAVMRKLRTAIASLVEATPTGARKSQDLQKLFGIDGKLSWQVFKLAGPGDALSLAPHVPSSTAMRRLLAAAKQHGISKKRVDDVRIAYESFERLVETHAGDRISFYSMANGLCDDDDVPQNDLQHRKARFIADRHYAGAEVDTLLLASILHPGSMPGVFDYLPIRYRLGQRRLRPDADVVVDRFFITDFDSTASGYNYEPLDPEAAKTYGAMLVPAFCSHPLPKLRTTKEPNGFTYARLDGDDVGHASRADLVFGQVHRNAPILDLVDGKQRWHTNAQITIPASVVIIDMLIHRAISTKWDYNLKVHWQGPREQFEPSVHMNDMHVLPFRERITKLSAGADSAYLREAPKYLDLLRQATTKFDWRLEDFDVYRARIEYPLLYTALLLTFEPETSPQ